VREVQTLDLFSWFAFGSGFEQAEEAVAGGRIDDDEFVRAVVGDRGHVAPVHAADTVPVLLQAEIRRG
jgi:hypothetical protein